MAWGISIWMLRAISPDGKTLDIPADGNALPGYKQALAEYQQRQAAIAAAVSVRRSSLRISSAGVEIRTQARGKLDVILFFATRRRELERRFPVMARALVAQRRQLRGHRRSYCNIHHAQYAQVLHAACAAVRIAACSAAIASSKTGC